MAASSYGGPKYASMLARASRVSNSGQDIAYILHACVRLSGVMFSFAAIINC